MTVPQWAWELAREFRRRAGTLDCHPYDIRAACGYAFPIRIEERRGLTVADVAWRLSREKIAAPREKNRALRACLVARRGAGWIFLDAADPTDEKAFSLAHEMAHFLQHHWRPRRAAESLGAVAAFDGERRPTEGERLVAALRGIDLAPYAHLMHRDPAYVLPEVRVAEEEADILAVELLAPEEELQARLGKGQGMTEVLAGVFGLPSAAARRHEARLNAK